MLARFVFGLCAAAVLAVGAVACGDDEGGEGGEGASGAGANVDCGSLTFDCSRVCENALRLCAEGTCGPTECDSAELCEEDCNRIKAEAPTQAPDLLRILLPSFNCLAANDSCIPYNQCIGRCLSEGGFGGFGG